MKNPKERWKATTVDGGTVILSKATTEYLVDLSQNGMTGLVAVVSWHGREVFINPQHIVKTEQDGLG